MCSSSAASCSHKAHKRIRELILFETSSSPLSLTERAKNCEAQRGTGTKPLSCQEQPHGGVPASLGGSVTIATPFPTCPRHQPVLRAMGARWWSPPGWLPPSCPGLAPAGSPHWLQGGGGRKAKCPHILVGDSIPRLFGAEAFCKYSPIHAQPGGEDSGGPGALLNPRGMGITGAKLCARNILLWMVPGHLVFQEGSLQLLARKRAGWRAGVLQADGHWLHTGEGATTLSVPPSRPKHELSTSLGSPHLKLERKKHWLWGFDPLQPQIWENDVAVLASQRLLPGMGEPGLPRHHTWPCRHSWVFRRLLPCRNISSFPLNSLTFSIFPRTSRVQQQGAPSPAASVLLSISCIASVPASAGPLACTLQAGEQAGKAGADQTSLSAGISACLSLRCPRETLFPLSLAAFGEHQPW